MIEVGSHNFDFLEDEFPTVGEIKRDLALYELPLDDQLSLDEGENLNNHSLQEMLYLPMLKFACFHAYICSRIYS